MRAFFEGSNLISFVWIGFWDTYTRFKIPRLFSQSFEKKQHFVKHHTLNIQVKQQQNFLINPLRANSTKWSNTLKQFVGKSPTNCLSVIDHFVGLVLKGFKKAHLDEYSCNKKRKEITVPSNYLLLLIKVCLWLRCQLECSNFVIL